MGIIGIIRKLKGDEESIFELFTKHSATSLECVRLVDEIITDYLNGKEVKEKVDRVDTLEDENDILNAYLNEKLFQGNLLPYTNEDWSKLASMIDSLSDISERIGKLLLVRKIKTGKNIKNDILELSHQTVRIAGLVHETIIYMRKDFRLAAGMIKEIASARHEARNLEYKIYSRIYNKTQLKDLILLKDIVYWTAQLANTSKRIAKHVSRVSAKYTN